MVSSIRLFVQSLFLRRRSNRTTVSILTIQDAMYSDRDDGPFACISVNERLDTNNSVIARVTVASVIVRVRG